MPINIENTDVWLVQSFGNGLAYGFTHKPSQRAGFVQGDDAAQWRNAYDAMGYAYMDPKSVWHACTWNACLAELIGEYLSNV